MNTLVDKTAQDLLARRHAALGAGYRLFYQTPLVPVSAQDVWIKDAAGRQYLDAYNNVPVLGHCHPAVVEALSRQASTLNAHTRYLSEDVVTYAERLLAHFPPQLNNAMFTCTGSEANDLAIRVAYAATGRKGLIVTENAYHGVTLALADLSPSLQPVAAHVRTVPAPDAYRGDRETVAAQFKRDIEHAIADLREAGIEPAALLLDTVFASDGIHIDDTGCLGAGAAAIREAGGLFIADEVQGGFCRTGQHWWAFERESVVPDMVTLGKPMGNGHPIGGLVLNSRLAEVFGSKCRYFNTFGGNNVSSAVGLAVLQTLEALDTPRRVAGVGDYMQQRLSELVATHEIVGDIRGRGLYWAMELVGDRSTKEPATRQAALVVNGLRENGVLVGSCGPANNILKIRPPLTFTMEHVDVFITELDRQLACLDGARGGIA